MASSQIGLLECVKRGMRLVLSGQTIISVSSSAHVNRNTLAKYLQAYPGITSYALKDVQLISSGRPPYLSDVSMEALKLFSLALDFCDYPISKATVQEAIHNLKKRENSSSEPEPPCKKTVRKIIKELQIPVRSLQKGVSIDACHGTKANEQYLGDYFEKLENHLQKYQVSASNIFNCDEVGVQMSQFGFQFLSSCETICGNLSNDHVSVLITTCADGSILPPYLLFPGEDSSVVPTFIEENKEIIWGTFSKAGWMDAERFQVYTLNLLRELKERSEMCDFSLPLTEYHFLLVDGHNSCLEPSTLFNCAVNCLLVLCGPSNLTNAWQPNDAGVNKSFKENLNKIVAKHVEAHQQFSSSDVSALVIHALQESNMRRSIINSF